MVVLTVSDSVEKIIQTYLTEYDFIIESGGIVVGTLDLLHNKVTATDLTEPQQKDIRKRYLFSRAEFGHQSIMDHLWEHSCHTKSYIGEWHTHDQEFPQPSNKDRKNWLKISKRSQNSNWLFFIIVGTKDYGVWTIVDEDIVEMMINIEGDSEEDRNANKVDSYI